MTRRKAKYHVSTTNNLYYTFSGNSRTFHNDNDSLVLYKKNPDYHERKNPRVKSRHPHESFMYSDDERTTTMTNWMFTNKNSAERAKKRLSKKRR